MYIHEESDTQQSTTEKEKHIFQKLTPVTNADLAIYNDALDYVFENDDIKNIAISGPYSSGKSSVIETYKINHTNIRFLHISLAQFTEIPENDTEMTSKINETIIEGKILNQLIHQIDTNNIPQTRFRIKKKITVPNLIKKTAIFMLFSIFFIYTIAFNIWVKYVRCLPYGLLKRMLQFTVNREFLFVSGLILFCISVITVYSVIKTQMNKNILKKLSIQGNEFEIFEESTDSCFDKHLNEVLYLFENSKSDAIVFEDMDRFNANIIFVKLKEINNLLNKKPNINIRFFYLLRDDIFISKDRTKFFDFILPIVPVIDSSNSYSQFIAHFKEGGIFDFFDENFLQGLSLYVDDMRILKNIYNEFLVYNNKIQSIELDYNKLLAIIVYKNLFPRDFNDLQLSRGFVHTLFNKKDDFITGEIKKIDEKIILLEKKIEMLNNEQLQSVDELDAIYFKFPPHTQIQIGGANIAGVETNLELIKKMKADPATIKYVNNGSWQSFDIQKMINVLSSNPEYEKRKKIINDKNFNDINKLNNMKEEAQNRKDALHNSKLKEIICKENIDQIFSVSFINEVKNENSFNEIKANPYFSLIKYLIRNGFIDETYADYMTYFYENSLSKGDKIFLRSITDEIPKKYEYTLRDPSKILSRLKVSDFDHEEILNFDLLTHLLKNKQENKLFIDHFINQLIKTKNIVFISKYLDARQEINTFLIMLTNLWPDILNCFLASKDTDERQRKQFVLDLLSYISDDIIKKLNKDAVLSSYISQSPTFLDIQESNIDLLISKFSMLDVKFINLEYDISNKDLFAAIYNNDLYQLTFEFISLILDKIYHIAITDDFKYKNYTLVSSLPTEPLNIYINKNIDDYISIILDNCNSNITDEELIALKILNHTDIEENNKNQYIDFLKTPISNIKEIGDVELWEKLIQNNCIKNIEQNILDYFFNNEVGLNSSLISFINQHKGTFNFSYDDINKQFGENSGLKFFNAIVDCDELFNAQYESILRSLNRVYNTFSKNELSAEKISILIKAGIIKASKENILFMRENYSDQMIQFIVKNIVQYIDEVIKNDIFSLNETLSLLKEDIDDAKKIKLLQNTKVAISVLGQEYTEPVKKHILKDNLQIDDIPELMKSFSKETENVRDMIVNVVIKNIKKILSDKLLIPYDLLTTLFRSKELDIEKKKEILASCLFQLDLNKTKESLTILQLDDYLNLFNHKRPQFVISPINEKLLTIFRDKKWITKFEIDKKNGKWYRAFGTNTN